MVQSLFSPGTGILNDLGYAANITAGGFTPSYSDLGFGAPNACT